MLWCFAVLTGLLTVDTPFRFCGDKDHHAVRKRALRSATSPSQGHLMPQPRGDWRPGPREGIHSGQPSPLCLPPSHTVPSAWNQTPHMKRLLEVGGMWLSLEDSSASGPSSANEESFIVLEHKMKTEIAPQQDPQFGLMYEDM